MSAAQAAQQAARLSDPVDHGLGMLGMIAGLVLGAIVGALIIAATILTGGAALAIAIAVVAAVGVTAGGGLAGEQLVNGLSTIFGSSGITTGAIIPITSHNVFTGGLPAARAKLDGAACNGLFYMNHPPMPKALIATGSGSVLINGMPAARKTDKLVCSGEIQKGIPTVLIGGPEVQVLPIQDNEAWMRDLLGKIALASFVGVCLLMTGGLAAGAISALAFSEFVEGLVAFLAVNDVLGMIGDRLGPGWRDTLQGGFGIAALFDAGLDSLRSIGDRPCYGEPVDGVTGEVCIQATDFVLPGALELVLERNYASGLRYGSCFGPRWCSTWGQYVENTSVVATYYSDDGRAIGFPLLDKPDEQGWLRNPLVDKIRLRRTALGFQVMDKRRRVLRFERAAGRRWLLSAIEDVNDNRIQFGYNGDGALRSVVHSGGYHLVVDGDASRIRRVALRAADDEIELVRYEYDDRGFLSAIVDRSRLPLRYEYDQFARITRWEDRRGTFYEYVYDGQGRCVEASGTGGMYHYRFQYDDARRMNYITDSFGAVTMVLYNVRLQVTATHDPNGGATVTEWDERNNKLSETDPAGRTVRYSYDADGNPLSAQDPLGRSMSFEYNQQGLPVVMTDAGGKRWRRSYDTLGNLISAGLEGRTPRRYERDANGNVCRVIDPSGKSGVIVHNAAGLPVRIEGSGDGATTYRRDALGRIVTETDTAGLKTEFRYAAIGKLGQVTRPDGFSMQWQYDAEGNLIRSIGPDGKSYVYTYGPFDLLARAENPLGGRLELTYDAEARLSVVTNELGETWRYEYGPTGWLVGEEDFSGLKLSYEYDGSGLCIKRVNALGEETSFKHDAAGQITERHSPGGAVTRFQYDVYGLLTEASNQSTTVHFERDDFGRVIREQQGDLSVAWRYDQRGLGVWRGTSSGHEINSRYDGKGQLIGLQLPGGEGLEFKRDVLGREVERRLTRQSLSGRSRGNKAGGFVLRQSYDALDRVVAQRAEVGAATSETAARLVDRSYQYDLNSNPMEIRDERWGAAFYEYDDEGRIRQVTRQNGANEAFQYDAAGNMTLVHGGPLTSKMQTRYIGRGGRLERMDEKQYVYDAAGRLIKKGDQTGTWSYEWNGEDQLQQVTTPSGEVWTYEYDAFSRRIRKQGPSSTTAYLWDGKVVAEEIRTTPAATQSSYWIFEPGTFRPIAKQEDGSTYACVTDQIGTPRELVTSEGTLAWSARLSVWGKVEQTAVQAADCPIRFQGQWSDEESGLFYNRFRYYDPETGQYISPDPIGLLGGTQSYGYVHNPLNWVDPFGLAKCWNTGDNQWRDTVTGDVTQRPDDPSELVDGGRIDYNDLNEWARQGGLLNRDGVPSGLGNNWVPDPTGNTFASGGFRYEAQDPPPPPPPPPDPNAPPPDPNAPPPPPPPPRYDYNTWGHGSNPNAPPGSNAATGPTTSITRRPIGGGPRRFFRTDGTWGTFNNNPNNAHIPLDNSPY